MQDSWAVSETITRSPPGASARTSKRPSSSVVPTTSAGRSPPPGAGAAADDRDVGAGERLARPPLARPAAHRDPRDARAAAAVAAAAGGGSGGGRRGRPGAATVFGWKWIVYSIRIGDGLPSTSAGENSISRAAAAAASSNPCPAPLDDDDARHVPFGVEIEGERHVCRQPRREGLGRIHRLDRLLDRGRLGQLGRGRRLGAPGRRRQRLIELGPRGPRGERRRSDRDGRSTRPPGPHGVMITFPCFQFTPARSSWTTTQTSTFPAGGGEVGELGEVELAVEVDDRARHLERLERVPSVLGRERPRGGEELEREQLGVGLGLDQHRLGVAHPQRVGLGLEAQSPIGAAGRT